MVSTNLDGFSLANHRKFAKFTKISPRQTFPLYGIHLCISNNIQLTCLVANSTVLLPTKIFIIVTPLAQTSDLLFAHFSPCSPVKYS